MAQSVLMFENKFSLKSSNRPQDISIENWESWSWQNKNALKTVEQLSAALPLTASELLALSHSPALFKTRLTPYSLSLINLEEVHDPVRRMLIPQANELSSGAQSLFDPLGERKPQNRVTSRLIHRYTDRVLFLATDFCSVYCRYCTRKNFTAQDQNTISPKDIAEALEYIREHTEIREVIFSGGDPLSLSNSKLEFLLSEVRSIPHIEIIRMGSRVPVVAPMRMDVELLKILKKYQPLYLMTHFNHPNEFTLDAAEKLFQITDSGIPVMNQMVLLNGVNNHPALVQALNRRLLYYRVKPYYMFQCDPSEGTDHLRTSIEESISIQRQLWGRFSGLAMGSLSMDIPDGGGKMTYAPNFEVSKTPNSRHYKGWDNVESEYINPNPKQSMQPLVDQNYSEEYKKLL